MNQTINERNALRSRISAGWAHDPAHYRFHRASPAEQAHIPFAETMREKLWRERHVIAEAVIGCAMLFGFLALLVFVPLMGGL